MTTNPANIGGASGKKSAGPDEGSVRATRGMVNVWGWTPQAPQEAARAAVTTGQLRTGRRLRAAMWMPQVAGTAGTPSLDSGKDSRARKALGAAWSCSTTSFLHYFQSLPFQPFLLSPQLKVKPRRDLPALGLGILAGVSVTQPGQGPDFLYTLFNPPKDA